MMGHIFPREPVDGWNVGDMAYCVRSMRGLRRVIEKGRIYQVAASKKPSNVGHHGLKLVGIDVAPLWGFWSNRFIKIGRVGGRLRRIAAATEYTMAHYWPALAATTPSPPASTGPRPGSVEVSTGATGNAK